MLTDNVEIFTDQEEAQQTRLMIQILREAPHNLTLSDIGRLVGASESWAGVQIKRKNSLPRRKFYKRLRIVHEDIITGVNVHKKSYPWKNENALIYGASQEEPSEEMVAELPAPTTEPAPQLPAPPSMKERFEELRSDMETLLEKADELMAELPKFAQAGFSTWREDLAAVVTTLEI